MKDGKYVIVLDAGHDGKFNQGYYRYTDKSGPDYWESEFNWKYSQMLQSELETCGFFVYNTRKTQSEKKSLYNRGYFCKSVNADIFISLHTNSPGSRAQTDVNGVVVIYSVLRPGTKELATKVANNIANITGFRIHTVFSRRGIKYPEQDYDTVFNGAADAGCSKIILIEHGFHTNPSNCLWLSDDSNLRKMAKEHARFWQKEMYGANVVEEVDKTFYDILAGEKNKLLAEKEAITAELQKLQIKEHQAFTQSAAIKKIVEDYLGGK